MTADKPELSPEEEARLLLHSVLPKLPEAIRGVMLADSTVLSTLGLPTGDFIRLWNRRFNRPDLFACLRNLANSAAAPLASADGGLQVEEAWLDEEGAGVLRVGPDAARFVNVAVLSDELDQRQQGIDAIIANGEMSAEREGMWRAAIGIAPLDDALFLALETELGASPEAAYRAMHHDIDEGSARFDDLVPLDLNHYAGLLGLHPPPPTLAEFKVAWLEHAAALDINRLMRLLKLSGPLSVLSEALVAQASDPLPARDRLALVKFLEAAPDPFSVVAAFEIACRHRADAEMQSIADRLTPRLFDRADPIIELAGMALASTAAITTALTARHRTLAALPLYAKRLARIVHSSQLLRLFRSANVDPSIFHDEVMRSFVPQARLADLSDAREAPVFQGHHLAPALIHATVASRVTEAFARIEEAERPAEWVKAGEAAVASDVDAGWGLFLFSPSPFDEFEQGWKGLSILPADGVEETRLALESGADPERCMSDLLKMSIAFEVAPGQRDGLAEVLPPFIKAQEATNFMIASEIALQLAARWRSEALCDRILDMLLDRARGEGLPDSAAAPRFTMLAAAAVEDRALWLKRAGNVAQHFAYVQKPGPPSINLMRALDLLRDFEPELGPALASAKSFTVLSFDRLPRIAAQADSESGIPD